MYYCLLEGHTEEELQTCLESRIRAAPVPTVRHYHTPPTPETWARVKTTPCSDSSPARTSYAQQFRKFFKSCGPLWPAGMNEFHMPGVKSVQTRTL